MSIFSKILGSRDISSDFLLSLDIGTEVVKALVFKIDPQTGNGIVMGVGRARQRLGDMQSGAVSDIAGVIENSKVEIEITKIIAGARKVG